MKAQIITLISFLLVLIAEAGIMVESQPMPLETTSFNASTMVYVGIAVIVIIAIVIRRVYPHFRARRENDDFHLFI